MISERTLKRWRSDALELFDSSSDEIDVYKILVLYSQSKARILRLTQELMDLHLMKKG